MNIPCPGEYYQNDLSHSFSASCLCTRQIIYNTAICKGDKYIADLPLSSFKSIFTENCNMALSLSTEKPVKEMLVGKPLGTLTEQYPSINSTKNEENC